MKIEFDDKSYVEVKKSDTPGKVLIIIGARDQENPLKKIINCVEINESQFIELTQL